MFLHFRDIPAQSRSEMTRGARIRAPAHAKSDVAGRHGLINNSKLAIIATALIIKLKPMGIPKSVENYLNKNKYKYQVVEHKTVYTAFDKAQTEHIKPKEIAKTLVIKADSKYVLAVVPADKKLDFVKLKKTVNDHYKRAAGKVKVKSIKKVELAKEVWMKKNILGKIGATPPFGKLLNLDLFVDRAILGGKKIQIGSGDYENSIVLNVGQFKKIEAPIAGSFSKKK